MKILNLPVPTPGRIRELRRAAGLSQEQAAERFDYSLRVWQTKECSPDKASNLRQGEYELLLLLAGHHPAFLLTALETKSGIKT
ncbi:helix-turn-helix transcriptional regulator [Erwiniaceae bacterium BAC15a-03b]|uniref:Helix-turn-helix transcriptional regulator n=1 Tax=Winslowiella arboricola TaxID=2978220 RepID=A0A9J6PVU8_9GAMM|nr:helix-turn-helix transcriptional regulator [Winslowiella arboricola]MCU5774401.1 helix-turn-helix transcriptional regulator [Winslowiella arboricola]MCU5778948.1 helix-turn-helix transcriptional regulator [Winslowiella arboricola]